MQLLYQDSNQDREKLNDPAIQYSTLDLGNKVKYNHHRPDVEHHTVQQFVHLHIFSDMDRLAWFPLMFWCFVLIFSDKNIYVRAASNVTLLLSLIQFFGVGRLQQRV